MASGLFAVVRFSERCVRYLGADNTPSQGARFHANSFAFRPLPQYDMPRPSKWTVACFSGTMPEINSHETLADLRVDIDRIDAALHQLLMERGEIINRLIAVKARQGGGSAFRPGREAAMMRALAERHQGLLPLDTVEAIWRVIISTFTYVQSPYNVHADFSGSDAAMRDSVRFHFGFTVPCIVHHGAIGVIDAVAGSSGDLGVFQINGGAAAGSWWTRLIALDAPKIIARLPFVERPDHPAGMPVFVISRPLAEAAARDIVLHVLRLDRWSAAIPAAVAALNGEIIGKAGDAIGLTLLIALPGQVSATHFREELQAGGIIGIRLAEAGSHAARFELAESETPPGVAASAVG
jgi:chorismate mutase